MFGLNSRWREVSRIDRSSVESAIVAMREKSTVSIGNVHDTTEDRLLFSLEISSAKFFSPGRPAR